MYINGRGEEEEEGQCPNYGVVVVMIHEMQSTVMI